KRQLWDLEAAGRLPMPLGLPQLLVVAGDALNDSIVADAAQCLDEGGTVLVINPSPHCARAIGEMVDANVTLTPADLCQLVPAKGRADDPLLAGLDLSDLCWLGEKDGEVILPWDVAVDSPYAQPLLVSNRTDWRRWVYRGENLKPGAIQRSEDEPYRQRVGLVRVPGGQGGGEVVICTVPVLPVHAKSMRVFAQLLTNLGVSWRRRAISDAQRAEFYLRAAGSIVQWLMLGPIRGRPWADLYAEDLLGGEASGRPALGQMAAGAAWAPRQTSPVVNLSDQRWYGALPDAAMYFAAYVRSPVARRVLLLVGSDDDVKLWFNGALVHAAQVARPVEPDQDRVGPVELRAGWNVLLAKVVNRTGNWGFSLRVVDENGRPLPDLSLAADDPEASFVEIAPDDWQASSQPPGDVAAAWDRRPETRWTSGRPMDDTMRFTLDLGQVHPVRRVILDTSGSPGDWPRGLRVEASTDAQRWDVIVDAPDAALLQQEGVTCVTFAPVPARYLQFSQTGPAGCSGGLYWSIHELHVFE
ncbi:MAG: discoidin domain-containing protein, partial [Armatimonadetes bacterium]|nr:discoidin domain-containing protein [Armatimonadota bacterium]